MRGLLLIGGYHSGEYVYFDPGEQYTETRKVLRPPPRLSASAYREGTGFDDYYPMSNVDLYYLTWVRPAGWVFYFRAYVLSWLDERDLLVALAAPPNRHTYCELPDAPREDLYECRRCRWVL